MKVGFNRSLVARFSVWNEDCLFSAFRNANLDAFCRIEGALSDRAFQWEVLDGFPNLQTSSDVYNFIETSAGTTSYQSLVARNFISDDNTIQILRRVALGFVMPAAAIKVARGDFTEWASQVFGTSVSLIKKQGWVQLALAGASANGFL